MHGEAKMSEIPSEILAKLEEMARKVEEARKAYEAEAARIAEEHKDAVKALEAEIAQLQTELAQKKKTLSILKKTRIAGVPRGGTYVARVAGGKADVLKWISENFSIGDEFGYAQVCKDSGFHKSNVYSALKAAMAEGWVEKVGTGKYKLVGEIEVS